MTMALLCKHTRCKRTRLRNRSLFFRRLCLTPVWVLFILGCCMSMPSPLGPTSGRVLAQGSVDTTQMVRQAAENGKSALAAMSRYSYYSDVVVQNVGVGDLVAWEYRRLSKVLYDRGGIPEQETVEEKSTLPKDEYVNPAAIDRLIQFYRFMVTPKTLTQYDFNYVGHERIDELTTVVFDIRPKRKIPTLSEGDRYLRGRVWIDEQDLQVVKVAGEILPEPRPHRTPRFETYFQNYDKYWLPAYIKADDDLQVDHDSNRVTLKVTFSSYVAAK
jgi:hypothetical protein